MDRASVLRPVREEKGAMRPWMLTLMTMVVLAVLAAALAGCFPRDCTGVDAEKLTVGEVDQLISRGWWGDPSDGMERLYPKECFPTEAQHYDGTLSPGSGA